MKRLSVVALLFLLFLIAGGTHVVFGDVYVDLTKSGGPIAPVEHSPVLSYLIQSDPNPTPGGPGLKIILVVDTPDVVI